MKKILTFGCLILGIMFFSNSNALAQEGDIQIGGGLIYGSGVFPFDEIDNDLGLRLEGIYSINEEFRAGADFSFFFPKEEGDVTYTLMAVNLNGNYVFYSEDELSAYGLGGINIAIISVDTPAGDDSESELGLNLGGGVEYNLDFGSLFGELKFAGIGGDADQLVIGAGVRFGI